jgi:hypothetical protein
MRDLFFQYYRYSESELKDLWKDCVFVIDANVLLNLYRYPKETSEELIKVFKKIKDRTWVPFQAALEYQESRRSVINEQVEKFNEVKSVFDQTVSHFKNKLIELQLEKRHSAINPSDLIEKLENLFGDFEDELDNLEEEQSKKYDNNQLRDQIDKLFKGRVTDPPSEQSKLDKIFEDGEIRYAEKIPPGFKDSNKGKGSQDEFYVYKKLKINRRFGDLLVWLQTIDLVKKENIRKLIFITDDNKEDWWWKKSGKIFGPHKSLVEEIKENTNIEKFWMYNSIGFIKNSQVYLDTKITEKAIENVEEVIKSKRAKIQKLELPEYYIPILSVLYESDDGKLTVQECIEQIEPMVSDILKEDDRKPLKSTGELRWHNNAKWARNDLRKLGYISSNSPRGIWEITEEGIEYLKNN